MANMVALNRTIEGADTDPMADESVELTEGQKACLRLVDDHMTSKEIGRSLGISHFTVDQRLDAARRKLNAATRKDAAKFLRLLSNAPYPSHSYTKRKTLSSRNIPLARRGSRNGLDGSLRKLPHAFLFRPSVAKDMIYPQRISWFNR